MFGTWFKPGDQRPDNAARHSVAFEISASSSQLNSESRPSLDRRVTTGISTPHDAVLAELFSQKPDGSPKMDEAPAETSSARDEEVTSEGHQRSRSPNREAVHDPFSGSIIGLAIPEERDDGVDFESTKDDLWTHMAHIREVQSQIANMHVLMEGIGLGPQGKQGTTGRSVPLVQPSADKWEEDEQDEEAEEKKAREQEFARLAEKFNGRREATDNIMNKLDELSQVVTAFHALRTPTMDFGGSRTNTRDTPTPAGVGQRVPADPPTVTMPPVRQKASQLPFVESPVSINISSPLPNALSSEFPSHT